MTRTIRKRITITVLTLLALSVISSTGIMDDSREASFQPGPLLGFFLVFGMLMALVGVAQFAIRRTA